MLHDFSDIRGQDQAIDAVVDAVRDRAPLLLSGPPGTGKTMIARRLPGLLPELTDHERIWIRAEFQYLDQYRGQAIERPFRAPHHTISAAALTSGRPLYGETLPAVQVTCRCKQAINDRCQWHTLPRAIVPTAGEARLARFGVLFLDELHEFTRAAIDGLARTMREMGDQAPYLVASANPCACGWRGFSVRECTCSDATVARHVERVQSACSQLRIVRRVDIGPVTLHDLRALPPGRTTAELRALAETRRAS